MAECAAHAHDLPEVAFLMCSLPADHDGPHWDNIDQVAWRVPISRAIPRVTQAYLSPSADVPACRDESPAWSASLAACYPDPPEYPHPEDDQAEQDSMNAEPDWRGDDEWFEHAW